VLVGTTIYAGIPASFAASAMDSAWLPDECVTTPRRFCSSLSDAIALYAPRNLKAPLHARREESVATLRAIPSHWQWASSLQQVSEERLRWLETAGAPLLELLALEDGAETSHTVDGRAGHHLHQGSTR